MGEEIEMDGETEEEEKGVVGVRGGVNGFCRTPPKQPETYCTTRPVASVQSPQRLLRRWQRTSSLQWRAALRRRTGWARRRRTRCWSETAASTCRRSDTIERSLTGCCSRYCTQNTRTSTRATCLLFFFFFFFVFFFFLSLRGAPPFMRCVTQRGEKKKSLVTVLRVHVVGAFNVNHAVDSHDALLARANEL